MVATHNELKVQAGFSGDARDKVSHEAVFGSATGEDGYASLTWGINHRWPHQVDNCGELGGRATVAGPSGLAHRQAAGRLNRRVGRSGLLE